MASIRVNPDSILKSAKPVPHVNYKKQTWYDPMPFREIFCSIILFIFLYVSPGHAQKTNVLKSPKYPTGQWYTMYPTISPCQRVSIGSLQTDESYANYNEHQGLFVGGYGGQMKLNDVFLMHEANASGSQSSGYSYKKIYYKSVYENGGRYRVGSENPADAGSIGTYTYYRSEVSLSSDGRWVDITDLILPGRTNTFSFYHNTGDGNIGYIIKTEPYQDKDGTLSCFTDFYPSNSASQNTTKIRGTGFGFDNFQSKATNSFVLELYQLYDYNPVFYSDRQSNLYWKSDIYPLINNFEIDQLSGNCFGMCLLAWSFYYGVDDIAEYYNGGKQNPLAIDFEDPQHGNTLEKIIQLDLYQRSKKFDDYYTARKYDENHPDKSYYTNENVFKKIKDYITSYGKADYVLGMKKWEGGGHAVIPYRVDILNDGDSAELYIYDPNHSGEDTLFITFSNLEHDSYSARWQYDDYDSYDGDSLYYYYLPNLYDGTPPTLASLESDFVAVTWAVTKSTYVLVRDSQANKLGYDSLGTFFNSITGAHATWNLHGDGKDVTSYKLPANGQYSIETDGSNELDLHLSSQGRSFHVAATKASDSDQVNLNSGRIGYSSKGTGALVALTAANTSSDSVYKYKLSNLSLQNNETLDIKIDTNNDLSINSNSASTSLAKIEIVKESATEQVVLEGQNVSLTAAGSQLLDVKDWDKLAGSAVELNGSAIPVEVTTSVKLPYIRKVKPAVMRKISKKSKTESSSTLRRLTISGKNFSKKAKVKVGRRKARILKKKKKKIIAVINPNKYKPGYYAVKVINPKGQIVNKEHAIQIKKAKKGT